MKSLARQLAIIGLMAWTPTELLPADISAERLHDLWQQYKSSNLDIKNDAARKGRVFIGEWLQEDITTMRKVIPVLVEGLSDDDPGVRLTSSAFFSSLALVRQRESGKVLDGVIPALIRGLRDPRARVRANLLRSLALLEPAPPQEAVEPFLKHLDDPSGEVRRMAVYGLLRATPQSQRAVEAVAALLDKKEDSERRREILQTLAFVKPTQPVLLAKVAEQLDEPNELLRFTTLRVLTEIGPPAAIAIHKIREIANDPATGKEMRISAEAALRAIEQRPPPKPRR